MNEVRKWPDAPNRIYLNVCDECSCDAKFMEHCEVTWCKDRQFESDIEYVRADAQPAVAVNEQMLNALKMVMDDPESLEGRPRTFECVVEAIAAAEAAKGGV